MHQVAIFTNKLPLTAKACAPSPQNELQICLDDRVTCLKFIAQVLASEAHRMTTAASADNIIPKRESINQRAETVIPDPASINSDPEAIFIGISSNMTLGTGLPPPRAAIL